MKWMVIALGIAGGLLLAGSPGAQAALSQIQVTQTVKVGRHPSGVAIDPGLSVAVTANQNGRSASIIDLGSGIVRDVPVGLHPVAVAVNPDTHEAVVANASSHSISVFSLTAIPPTVRTIPVGRRPVAVAVHPGQNRAVVANQHTNTVSVVDLASGSVVATLPVGRHPSGVAVNPATGMAAVTNQLEDTATLVDLIGSAVHSVIVLDRANFQRKHLKPTGIDYDTTTNSLAVANTGDDSVSVLALDGASRPTSQAIVPVGKKPFGIAVSSGNDFALVTSDKDDVFALDLFDRSVFAKADVGKRPRGVAVDPASCRAVVTNTKDDTISVLRVPCNVLKLDALDPTGALMGSGPLTLILSGTGFVAGSVVNFGPSPALVPSAISPLSITVTVPASRLTSAGTIDVSVKTPSETSNRLPFVVSRFLPPILTGLTPSTRTADFQDWVLTVSGSNFRPDAVITFNGCPLSPSHPAECPAATTVVDSSTKAHATVPAILVAQGAVAPVSIVNPDGVASNSLAFLIVNPVPVLSTLTPNNAEAGAGDTEVVAIGSSFVLSSQVLFCGATCTPIPAVPLLANPPVQINATIPASLLTTPGVYAVRVFNPPPGGGLSFDQPFTVRAPAPPPPGYTVSVLPVPTVAGHPEHVTLVAPGVAAVTLQDRVQLVNLAGKSLIDAPIGVPSTAGFLGDIDADPARGIFVVTDPAGDTASVVEVNFGDPAASVITTVLVGYFPFGVAVNPTTNQAVVTNVGDLTLSVIDLGTKQLVRTIPLAGATNPTYVAVNPSTNLAVVVDQDFVGASSAILVDVASGQVLRTLRVGVGATLPAVDPGLDEALVANSLDDSLALIDLGRRRVDRTIPVGQLPQGVAIDAGAHRAMVADTTSNDILFVDLQTFALGDVVKLGSGGAEAPFDLAWDVAGKVAIATSAAVGPVTRNNLILIDLPR